MTIVVLMKMCVICTQFAITGIINWILYEDRGTGNDKGELHDKN